MCPKLANPTSVLLGRDDKKKLIAHYIECTKNDTVMNNFLARAKSQPHPCTYLI